MSDYINLKYINLLSSRLGQFKQKTNTLFNFRCPYCGDSKKDKTKARGYIYRVKNDMFFKCHNCGEGANFVNFLKYVDGRLHSDYLLEKYKKPVKQELNLEKMDFKPAFKETGLLDKYKKISDLEESHPARKYVEDRKIPKEHFDKLYLVNKFYELANKIKNNTFNVKYEHPRLVIPFYDIEGKLFALQGRAFGKEEPKYITLKLDESKQKIYGLERINFAKQIRIVEGPIDSLFLDNCLAAAGADLFMKRKIAPDNITYIFDNEPRNKEIVKRMYDVIEKDYNIVIWPEDIKEKDINDMILRGLTKSKIEDIISENTYSKLSAITKINYWKRV